MRSAYVVPHRRAGTEPTPQRPLDAIGFDRFTVLMTIPSETEISPADCPFDVDPVASSTQEDTKEYHLILPEGMHHEVAGECLQWFKDLLDLSSTPEALSQGRLQLPPSLSKQQRALWHHEAQRLELSSQSEGVRDERLLVISSKDSDASLPRKLDKYSAARKLWGWCQDAGLWSYSQGEITHALKTDSVPPDIRSLIEQHQQAEQLHKAILQKDEASAIAFIDEMPSTAHTKGAGGNYAIHLACEQELESLVALLVRVPGVTQQKNANRMVPLDLVYSLPKHKQGTLAGILKSAGAKSYGTRPPLLKNMPGQARNPHHVDKREAQRHESSGPWRPKPGLTHDQSAAQSDPAPATSNNNSEEQRGKVIAAPPGL
ncbi:hypothetical protein WJX73_002208 [Symbiochloris irregularis]|uniref:Uncharacterized protein n=1 Tax=Symbiochloris irregularis TaxID=706552 RepID=A0AAW1P5Q5_9CHLO